MEETIKSLLHPSTAKKTENLYRTLHYANYLYRTYNQGLRRLRQWINQLQEPPARILDVGCGNGLLCKTLSMMGYEVTGTDVADGPYDRQNYYKFIKHNLMTGPLPFKDNEFDYCVSFDVLEHLPPKWVGHTIYEMQRVSKKDHIIGTAACFASSILHLTVREPDWWKELISRISIREMHYEITEALAGQTILFQTRNGMKE